MNLTQNDIFQNIVTLFLSSNLCDIFGGYHNIGSHVGLSENSVPLHPMVNDHYPY